MAAFVYWEIEYIVSVTESFNSMHFWIYYILFMIYIALLVGPLPLTWPFTVSYAVNESFFGFIM